MHQVLIVTNGLGLSGNDPCLGANPCSFNGLTTAGGPGPCPHPSGGNGALLARMITSHLPGAAFNFHRCTLDTANMNDQLVLRNMIAQAGYDLVVAASKGCAHVVGALENANLVSMPAALLVNALESYPRNAMVLRGLALRLPALVVTAHDRQTYSLGHQDLALARASSTRYLGVSALTDTHSCPRLLFGPFIGTLFAFLLNGGAPPLTQPGQYFVESIAPGSSGAAAAPSGGSLLGEERFGPPRPDESRPPPRLEATTARRSGFDSEATARALCGYYMLPLVPMVGVPLVPVAVGAPMLTPPDGRVEQPFPSEAPPVRWLPEAEDDGSSYASEGTVTEWRRVEGHPLPSAVGLRDATSEFEAAEQQSIFVLDAPFLWDDERGDDVGSDAHSEGPHYCEDEKGGVSWRRCAAEDTKARRSPALEAAIDAVRARKAYTFEPQLSRDRFVRVRGHVYQAVTRKPDPLKPLVDSFLVEHGFEYARVSQQIRLTSLVLDCVRRRLGTQWAVYYKGGNILRLLFMRLLGEAEPLGIYTKVCGTYCDVFKPSDMDFSVEVVEHSTEPSPQQVPTDRVQEGLRHARDEMLRGIDAHMPLCTRNDAYVGARLADLVGQARGADGANWSSAQIAMPTGDTRLWRADRIRRYADEATGPRQAAEGIRARTVESAIADERQPIYVYVNKTTHDDHHRFDLVRLKCTMALKGPQAERVIAGDIVDVAVHHDDYVFRRNFKFNYKDARGKPVEKLFLYTLHNMFDGKLVQFETYGLVALIHDALRTVFLSSRREADPARPPWRADKYEKRVKRIMALLLCLAISEGPSSSAVMAGLHSSTEENENEHGTIWHEVKRHLILASKIDSPEKGAFMELVDGLVEVNEACCKAMSKFSPNLTVIA